VASQVTEHLRLYIFCTNLHFQDGEHAETVEWGTFFRFYSMVKYLVQVNKCNS